MLKKLLLHFLLIALMLSAEMENPVYADGYKNELLKEDFAYDYPGEKPVELTVSEDANSTVKVVTAKNEAGKYKNMLHMTDKGEKSLASATIKVPSYKDSVTMEVKFKLKKTSTDGYGFIIDFLGNDKRALRILKYSNSESGFNLETNAGNSALTPGVEFHDKWFTLKIRLDSKNKRSSLAWEGSSLGYDIDTSSYSFLWQDKEEKRIVAYNRPWFNEYDGGNLTNVTFSTYGLTAGECYIDYIAFYETDEEYYPVRKRALSKEILTSYSPKMRLVPWKLNIVRNNEVKYSANPSFAKNGVVFADAEAVADWYGMGCYIKNGTCTLKKDGKEFIFKEGENEFLLNGLKCDISAICEEKENVFYLPVGDVSEAFGENSIYDSEKDVLYIDEKSDILSYEKEAQFTPDKDISNGMLVIAGYDSYGKLKDVSLREGDFKKGEKVFVYLDESQSYYKTVVFLWKKGNITPIIKEKVRINY